MSDFTDEMKTSMKLSTIVSLTENKIGSMKYSEIQRRLENIDPMHHQAIEDCIHKRDTKNLGMLIMMGIYQDVQADVTQELKDEFT